MRFVLLAAIFVASTVSAHAQVAVPEIDAYSGMSALGVLGAVGALMWERRRGARR